MQGKCKILKSAWILLLLVLAFAPCSNVSKVSTKRGKGLYIEVNKFVTFTYCLPNYLLPVLIVIKNARQENYFSSLSISAAANITEASESA